jgi:poly(3-hydroxybutyrate) depolymerase
VTYEIQGGGHRWPPFTFDTPTEAMVLKENGPSSRNLDATEVIWTFFAGHARR